MELRTNPTAAPNLPAGILRLDYRSPIDSREDWALFLPGKPGRPCVVHLHGHGSTGDQIFTRVDIRKYWLAHYRERGLSVLSPNLRGNAWMGPAAAADLRVLLDAVRRQYGFTQYHLLSGSMGGTSNLIYTSLFPDDVAAVIALCPVSDIRMYHQWCVEHPGGVVNDIRAAMEASYGGTPAQVPARYEAHRAIAHAAAFTMPLLVIHGTADALIPIEHSRALADRLRAKADFTYREIPGGNHDAPLHDPGVMTWLDEHMTA